MNFQLQVLAVSLLALLVTAHAQISSSKQSAKTRESQFLPSLIIKKVASYFRITSKDGASVNDKTARSDLTLPSQRKYDDSKTSEREEISRSSILSFRLLNPIQSLFNKASSTIASVASKLKNNLSSRISFPSANLAASKKDNRIAEGNTLANIIAKDISMNLEEEIERNKKWNKNNYRKISFSRPLKIDTLVNKLDSTESETKLQTADDEQISYAPDKFSPKDMASLKKIEEDLDRYDPFYSINGADPEIVRHFDPDGDSTQFLLGEKKEEPKSNPFAILYHLYSAWGEEPVEEKYDARGWHLYE